MPTTSKVTETPTGFLIEFKTGDGLTLAVQGQDIEASVVAKSGPIPRKLATYCAEWCLPGKGETVEEWRRRVERWVQASDDFPTFAEHIQRGRELAKTFIK